MLDVITPLLLAYSYSFPIDAQYLDQGCQTENSLQAKPESQLDVWGHSIQCHVAWLVFICERFSVENERL
jgi:hypothetical protein